MGGIGSGRTKYKHIDPDAPPKQDISIDDLLGKGLASVQKALEITGEKISSGEVSKETVSNLKDILEMLKGLKKIEMDILESSTDEQLKKMIKR